MILLLIINFVILNLGFYLTYRGSSLLIELIVEKSSDNRSKMLGLISLIVGVIICSVELCFFYFLINNFTWDC